MRANHITKLLRADLLEGLSVLLVSPPAEDSAWALGAAVRDTCVGLGARVSTCGPSVGRRGSEDAALDVAVDAAVTAAVREVGGLDLLVVDGAGLFASALAGGAGEHGVGGHGGEHGAGGRDALRACMEVAWGATRATVNHAFLAPTQTGAEGTAERSGGSRPPRPRAGRIFYLAPAAEAGEHAEAACAGLENLARTLSIEWARYGITTVAIAPGAASTAEEVAALSAYLASPAGAYFSGCLLDLRGP